MPLVLNRRLQPLHGLIDLVPVVTVVLLLLLFFLLSSSFVLQPGIKIDPPRSAFWSGTPSSRLIVAVTLAPAQVDANGVAQPRQPVLYFNDQVVTLDGLRAALDKLPTSRNMPELILDSDKDVPLDVVTDIMNVGFAHHYAIHLETKAETGTP
jgi:biopolymer transport protein ExbD